MPKRSKKILKPWLSALPDNQERFFLQVGGSLLLRGRLRTLTHTARWTYLCMAAEAGTTRRFTFPTAVAEQKYGIARNTFRDNLRELLEAGMIVIVLSGQVTRTPNIYEFCFNWKTAEQDEAPVKQKTGDGIYNIEPLERGVQREEKAHWFPGEGASNTEKQALRPRTAGYLHPDRQPATFTD